MNSYKQMIYEQEDHKRIFRKLMKIDNKAQRESRTLWLENQLDCIDFDDYHGSEKEKRVRAKAKKLTPAQLSNYMIDFYDAPLEMFSKKSLKNLTSREKEFVLDILSEDDNSYKGHPDVDENWK